MSAIGAVIELIGAALQLAGSVVEHNLSKKESKENPEKKKKETRNP